MVPGGMRAHIETPWSFTFRFYYLLFTISSWFLFNLALPAPFLSPYFALGATCVCFCWILCYIRMDSAVCPPQSSASTAKNAGHQFALVKFIPEVGRKHLECLPKIATKLVKVPRPLLNLSL